jgi:hypothetical protein
MTNLDHVKLLFGPYHAPPLKRGDRAFCFYRDCLVYITSWTDAPTPWPRCRRLEPRVGLPGLLIDEELARAVRHESTAAIKFWWGVGNQAIANWRRALGVGRMNNEGSRRLITTALANATEVWKRHE